MAILETYGKEIVSLLVPLIAWALKEFFSAKSKLEYASPHRWHFMVQQPLVNPQGEQVAPNQFVKTHSYIIRNNGRAPATRIELVFNWRPQCINHWPVRHHTEHTDADGRYIVIFDTLAPSAVVGVEIMAVNGELPALITVTSAEGNGRLINMYPQRVFSQTFRIIAATFLLLGAMTAIYLTLTLIQFIVLKTPS